MAAEVDSPPVVSTKRLEGSLVSPRSFRPVPNHLAETRTFTQGRGHGGVLQTSPSVLHFSGYRVGDVHQQTLRVINASKDNQQMHIIPPSTSFFSIRYSKQNSRLVPGLSLDITVQFKPTEWKYYYDCIRIHCKDEQNLLVPIHAYPVMSTAKFPSHVRFPPTPVGHTRSKTLSLECDVPIDFEFQLSTLQQHPAFSVTPMRGIVPANGKVDVKVTFAPTEFSTAIMKLKLELTQFNSSPLVCTFSGSSLPGLDVKSASESRYSSQPPARLTKTVSLPPLEKKGGRGWGKGRSSGRSIKSSSTIASKADKEVVYEGVAFPARMDNPAAVGRVLTQQPARQRARQLKQTVGDSDCGNAGSRHAKEAAFLKRVKKAAEEERANRLRWVTHLGDTPPPSSFGERVLRERKAAEAVYLHIHCHKPLAGEETSHTETECVYRRTRRRAHEQPHHTPTFDPYTNNLWLKRHRAQQRFRWAGRRIILQVRVQKRLEKVRRLVDGLKNGTKQSAGVEDHHTQSLPTLHLPRSPLHILPLSFPRHTSHSSTTAQHTAIEVKPTEVKLHKQIPTLELKVPHHCQLLGYYTPSPSTLGPYVPPGLPRPLLTGAEAELSNLGHIPGVDPAFLSSSPPRTLTSSTTRVQDVEGEGEEERESTRRVSTEQEIPPLTPPPSLFKEPERNPLHIFNPCPGVLHHMTPLPHSEVTLEHVLLPLPPYPTAKHPHIRLHPQDVIPGVMHWKQFPCQWLVSSETERKRRRPHQALDTHTTTDPFSQDMIPAMSKPHLLSGPQPDDLVDESNTEVMHTPTLEMVRAQFSVPEQPATSQEENSRTTAEDHSEPEQGQLGVRVQQRLHEALKQFNTSRRSDNA